MDVIDSADKVQLTSSDKTFRQMYPLTRSSGTLCVACCCAHELDSQQRTDYCSDASESLGDMRLLSVVHGTLAVFLHVHCSPLDQHLVQFGTEAACGLRLRHTEFYESVDQHPAHWLHPQSSASVLSASFVRALRGGRCGHSRCEPCRVESPCVLRVLMHDGHVFLLTNSTDRASA